MPFTDDTLEFLVRNRLTDSRPWFHEHREEYEKLVVEPMAELVTALTGGLLGMLRSALPISPNISIPPRWKRRRTCG